VDGSVGAGFLAAVAADAAVVVVPGRLRLITVVPVNGLGADGTHLNADTAEVAPGFIDNRPLGYTILDEGAEPAAGTVGRRRPLYLKARVEEGINVSA